MKNRTSLYIVGGLITLAVIGVGSSLISNPKGFFQGIFMILIVGSLIYFLVRHFNGANPKKREQSAFRKAAKRSNKRLRQKETRNPTSKTTAPYGNITKLRRPKHSLKSSSHLTVIEGKKGKKKNRASF